MIQFILTPEDVNAESKVIHLDFQDDDDFSDWMENEPSYYPHLDKMEKIHGVHDFGSCGNVVDYTLGDVLHVSTLEKCEADWINFFNSHNKIITT